MKVYIVMYESAYGAVVDSVWTSELKAKARVEEVSKASCFYHYYEEHSVRQMRITKIFQFTPIITTNYQNLETANLLKNLLTNQNKYAIIVLQNKREVK